METLFTVTLGAAWIAIIGMLAWGVATGWRRVMRDDAGLPLFAVLQRRGLTVAKLEAAPETLFGAVRRCALCGARSECAGWLATGKGAKPACPNEGYFEEAARA